MQNGYIIVPKKIIYSILKNKYAFQVFTYLVLKSSKEGKCVCTLSDISSSLKTSMSYIIMAMDWLLKKHFIVFSFIEQNEPTIKHIEVTINNWEKFIQSDA